MTEIEQTEQQDPCKQIRQALELENRAAGLRFHAYYVMERMEPEYRRDLSFHNAQVVSYEDDWKGLVLEVWNPHEPQDQDIKVLQISIHRSNVRRLIRSLKASLAE